MVKNTFSTLPVKRYISFKQIYQRNKIRLIRKMAEFKLNRALRRSKTITLTSVETEHAFSAANFISTTGKRRNTQYIVFSSSILKTNHLTILFSG